jgi:dihydroorotate dehydrogenase electron transfer subunit
LNNHPAYQTFRLVQIRPENNATKSLVFDRPLNNAQPGQFVMVWLPDIGEKPYSILNGDPFSVAATSAGPFSNALNNWILGDRVWVRGPLGHGFQLDGSRHLLVGGGYGTAPLLFLARQACRRKDRVKVCLGARTEGDLLMVDACKALGCEVFITTNDGSLGEMGLVTHAVESVLQHFKADTLYACGPVPMLSALAGTCKKQEVASQLSWEAQMRCGIGLCGSCELDEEIRITAGLPVGWLTCKDGPVYFNS